MDRATFTKEIALALQDIEKNDHDTNHHMTTSNHDRRTNNTNVPTTTNEKTSLIHETYEKLCYDDPMYTTISIQGCQLLYDALLDMNIPYSISERLLHGIHQYYYNTTT